MLQELGHRDKTGRLSTDNSLSVKDPRLVIYHTVILSHSFIVQENHIILALSRIMQELGYRKRI
jgi:hypothetical protein